MKIIDADAHVVESERTWDFLDETDRQFAPQVMVFKDRGDGAGPRSGDEFWKIGGRVFAKGRNIGHDTSRESREMESVKARLAHMDELEIDVQVLYPSLFLRALAPLPHVDLALCKSYNRWLIVRSMIVGREPHRQAWPSKTGSLTEFLNFDSRAAGRSATTGFITGQDHIIPFLSPARLLGGPISRRDQYVAYSDWIGG